MTQLGDMTVGFEPTQLPPRIWQALAVIATHTHEAYDHHTGLTGGSKDKCLFTSLAIRDFLVAIGIPDTTVCGCTLFVYANKLTDDRDQIWSVGVGAPDQPPIAGKFNGHAVVISPSLGLMIDATMYQTIRPHWRGAITGMMALPYWTPTRDIMWRDMPVIAGANHELDDRVINAVWTDRPDLEWRKSDDFRVRSPRRIAVTKSLRDAFDGCGIERLHAGTKKAPA